MSENIDIEKEKNPADSSAGKRHGHHSSHHRSHHSDRMSRRYEDSQQKVVKDTFRKVRREKVYKPIFRAILGIVVLAVIIMFFWTVINPPEDTYERGLNSENVTQTISVEEKINTLKREIEKYREKIAELENEITVLEAESTEDTEVTE